MPKKDLFMFSEYSQVISMILKQEFRIPVILAQLHDIKMGDGNSLFYAITREGTRYLINIMGRKVQDNALLFWIENIDYSGKVCELFYQQDVFILTFQRGEKYNHEFLVYLYYYGNKYPAVRHIPGKMYRAYSKMLSRIYSKHIYELPADLRVAKNIIL